MNIASGRCILFATMEFHPTLPGGAGTLIYNTTRLLVSKGHRVLVLVDCDPTSFQKLHADWFGTPCGENATFYSLDHLCEDLRGAPDDFDSIAIRKSIRLDHALRKLTAMHVVDLIELYDYCGHGFHYLSRPESERPVVAVRLHGTIELVERRTRAPLTSDRIWQYPMERAQIALADALLVSGRRYYDDEVQPLYRNTDPDKVLVSPPVHLPIGTVDYDNQANDVVFYGRLSALKGLDTFLRAAAIALQDDGFREWLGRFVVVGPEENVSKALSPTYLRALLPPAQRHRVVFTGRQTHPQLLGRLQSAAFACFPARIESFCYAAHEVHTAGMPLIVNRIATFEDYFTDGGNAVFFDGTARDLAERMKMLAASPELRGELARRGVARAEQYFVDHYVDHIERLQSRSNLRPKNLAPAMSGSVIVLSNGNAEAEARTLSEVSEGPLRPFVLTLDDNGSLRFAASRWRGRTTDAAGGDNVGLEPVGNVCLFLRAGDLPRRAWIDRALAVLQGNDRVSAVTGWLHGPAGILSMPHTYIPELGYSGEPGLRTMIRTRPGQIIAEYLNGWASDSEVSYLLEHRAAGGIFLELPELAIDARGSIDLPRVTDGSAAVDFDRYSREFLSATRAIEREIQDRADPVSPELPDPDVVATTLTPSLVVVRKAEGSDGELWVLRLLRGDQAMELPWSSAELSGVWNNAFHPSTAAGTLWTNRGSIRFHMRGRVGIELLAGPYCAAAELVYGGRIYPVELRRGEVESHMLWLPEAAGSDGKLDGIKDRALGRGFGRRLPVLRQEHASLNAGDMTLAVLAAARTGPAGELAMHPGCRVFTPDEFGPLASAPNEGISGYAAALIRHLGVRVLGVDVGLSGAGAFAEAFLSEEPGTRAIALINPIFPSSAAQLAAEYTDAAVWLQLGSRFPRRVIAAGCNGSLLGLFARAGIETIAAPPHPPSFDPVSVGDLSAGDRAAGIDVIVLPSPSVVPSSAHLVTAVMLAGRYGLKIRRLLLPETDTQGAAIVRTFDAALRVDRYADVAAACETSRGNPMIALAVYPDDNPMPPDVALAMGLGALPILGPSSIFAQCPDLGGLLNVVYWEQPEEIAAAMARAVEQLPGIVAAYGRFRAEQLRLRDEALASLLQLASRPFGGEEGWTTNADCGAIRP